MADRWLTDEEKIMAKTLRQNGHSYEEIAKAISEVAEDGHKPNRSTVYRAIRNMPESSEDVPFEWHRMGEYGLPWEASHYLLEMWAQLNESEAGFDLDSTYSRKVQTAELTVRQAKWCWRVHLSAPDLGFRDTWQKAQDFVYEERRCDFLGKPFDAEDLWAYLAYGEWRSEDHRKRYRKAVNERRIPAKKHRASGSVTAGARLKARAEVIHKQREFQTL
jgi:hypothetical protein